MIQIVFRPTSGVDYEFYNSTSDSFDEAIALCIRVNPGATVLKISRIENNDETNNN